MTVLSDPVVSPGRRLVRAVGDAALLVAVDNPHEARSLAAAVSAASWPGVRDVVGGLRSVLVTVDPVGTDLAEMAAWLAELDPRALPVSEPRTIRIPVCFGGPDTEEVCRLLGINEGELVDLLTAAVLEVAVVGFSPGFGYLTGLPEPLRAVGRRDRPRPSVPAGSIAVAGGFAAVYPQSTPGGWNLIGRTPLQLFDPTAPPYALLRPGDVVRFEPIEGEAAFPRKGDGGRRNIRPSASESTVLVVEDPGLFTTVQDGGRRGVAHLGVPGAGPADPLAHGLANRLVGNRADAAALEMTAKGPVLRCVEPGYLAVVGGDPEVSIDGHEVGGGRLVPVAAGQRVVVGPFRSGLHAYLAWAGGVVVPEVMGSCSTDVLSGLGPGALAVGDELGAGLPVGPLGDHLRTSSAEVSAASPGADTTTTVTLRVLPGPHPEWFPEGTLERLASLRLRVEGTSDRVGVRLCADDGGRIDRIDAELDPQGMVTGAVQVPPDGAPVILGPDHATLGGYPVVAVVVSADRWKLGQCRPSDLVCLLPVTPDEASRALAEQVQAVETAVVGRYPVVAG
jgi:KipI family sensor histidine kinase inhibitor